MNTCGEPLLISSTFQSNQFNHDIKACKNSATVKNKLLLFYLGQLFVRARSDIRFGIINQLSNQDVTHFKAEMQCPGLHKHVTVSPNFVKFQSISIPIGKSLSVNSGRKSNRIQYSRYQIILVMQKTSKRWSNANGFT